MTSCTEARTSLGVYVLGAIEPAERSRLETHVGHCPNCRDELAGMAGLPALLGRVSEPQIEHAQEGGHRDGPPGELLDSLLAKAAAQRWAERPRRRPAGRAWAAIAVAATVLLVAGFVLGGLLPGSDGNGPPVATKGTSPAVSAPPADPTALLEARDPKTGVSARITMVQQEWGTALAVRVSNAPKSTKCRLYAIGFGGERDIAASWEIEPEGYGDYMGSTMFQPGAIKAFAVITLDGRMLITIPNRV